MPHVVGRRRSHRCVRADRAADIVGLEMLENSAGVWNDLSDGGLQETLDMSIIHFDKFQMSYLQDNERGLVLQRR